MTDKKIENQIKEILEDLADKEYLLGQNRGSGRTDLTNSVAELTNLLNTEVQKAREDGVRGFLIEFSKVFEKDKSIDPLEFMETYLQSLDKGDRE